MIISKQRTALLFRLSISVTVFGALFKFVSWPLIILGAAGMVIFHSIQFFQNESRQALDYSRHLLIVFFACNYVLSIFELPYAFLFMLLTKIALIAFVLLYVKEIIAPSNEDSPNIMLQSLSTENLSHLLADLATVYIVIASLFRILDWEFGIINANLLLVIGLFSAVISILASSVSLEK